MANGTAEEQAKIDSLVKKNDSLRAELVALNEDIDRKLKLKGEAVSNKQLGSPPPGNAYYDHPVVRENERARRENAKLLKRLHENETVAELQAVRDLLKGKQQTVDSLKAEAHTLEQITRHQSRGLDQVERLKTEADDVQREHAQEVAQLKDEIKAERALKDEAQKAAVQNQARIASLKSRITAAKSPMAEKWASIDKLRETLSEKDAALAALQEEIASLKKRSAADEETKQLRREHKEATAAVAKVTAAVEEVKLKIVETDKVLKMSASPYLWKYHQPSPAAV